ncbi:Methyltransferase domain-containing protein [Micromonospora echinospora]|uniref:site-specific DNA-methyltransferase (adenine-specific) n=1 Tax=Micromonospora echinospora TaxID=1877 RepID=A0A1C4VMW1_MICEC|nr:N-6 DNA methylase [Micromonospora echinospora]SCE85145.1 Methyltransferase domain-containing protein [Micromonospora echinospora]
MPSTLRLERTRSTTELERLEDRPAFGEVFTRRWVVDTLLDMVGYTADADLPALTIVDPSAGSGAFLTAAVQRLLLARRRTGTAFASLDGCLRAFDVQSEHVARCRHLVEQILLDDGCPVAEAAELSRIWVIRADYLLDEGVSRPADVIIGNPPYIRIEDLPTEINEAYRRRWSTMTGRADVYVGFIQRGLSTLKPGGRLGFICADRWMRNQYGAALRRFVTDGFSVDAVWTMHDVDAFESRVSAYPAITLLRRGEQGSAVVADTDASFGAASAAELVRWSQRSETNSFQGSGFAAHRLPHWFPGDEMWPAGSPARLAMIEHLKDNFSPLHDPDGGTRVGIGVATGADQVFVTTDGEAVEPDRLLPLSMVRDIATGAFAWSGRYLVNPWEADGSLVDLNAYPRLRAYLARHSTTLRGRFIAKQRPATWYRTIDKVNHELTARPKLLLQDMKTTIHPVLERGGSYPHHNLYFVVSDVWDMEVLGGLLLSGVAQAFIEAYCVRMRGGTLRFQAQYLKQIRVPQPGAIDTTVGERLRLAFRHRDRQAATRAAVAAYGLDTFDLD